VFLEVPAVTCGRSLVVKDALDEAWILGFLDQNKLASLHRQDLSLHGAFRGLLTRLFR
jgi:hypothetical protein